MKILVTGHRGYIGALAVEMLKEHGFTVVGLDVDYYDDCAFYPGVQPDREMIKDIRDVTAGDVQGVDAVFHFAALSNDPSGELNPGLTETINYRASVRLAELAREQGVERFIFSSSCSLYGKAQGDAEKTEADETNPLTAYAKSKILTEQAIQPLANDHFSPVCMRNATAYGASPKLRLDLVLNNLLGTAFTLGQIRILSDGTPWRPLVHARDIVNAFIAVTQAPRESVHNQIFNVGENQENYQVRDIAEIIKDVTGIQDVVCIGEHGNDSRSYRVNFDKLHCQVPAFKAQWDARRGAEELLEKMRHANFSREDFESRKYTRLKQLRYLSEQGSIDGQLRRVRQG